MLIVFASLFICVTMLMLYPSAIKLVFGKLIFWNSSDVVLSAGLCTVLVLFNLALKTLNGVIDNEGLCFLAFSLFRKVLKVRRPWDFRVWMGLYCIILIISFPLYGFVKFFAFE